MFYCPVCEKELDYIQYEEYGSVYLNTFAEDGNRTYLCPFCENEIIHKNIPEEMK